MNQAAPHFGLHPARWLALAAFAAALALAITGRWDAVAAYDFGDPDDGLRMVQVRDLLAGQGWFDVGQARINPPGGGDMHWSRLIDAPMAAIILLARPLLGGTGAEIFAAILWPLLLLTMLAALLLRLCRWIGRPGEAEWLSAAAIAVLALMPITLLQFAPLRIDHHGAQALLALAAVAALLMVGGWRGAALAGAALAVHANISIEALPLMVIFAAVLALDWLRAARADAGTRLLAYLAALTGAAIVLLALTHGSRVLFGSFCDALSAPYAAALVTATIGAAISVRLGQGSGWPLRLLLIVIAGGTALAIMLAVAPQCAAGPFAALPPRVADLWYANVLEGLPLWRQDRAMMLASVLPSLLGLAGLWLGWRRAGAGQRDHWRILLLLAAGGVLLSLLLLRAVYVAHLLVAPGMALLFILGWRRARALARPAARVLATVATLLVMPAPLAVTAEALAGLVSPGTVNVEAGGDQPRACPAPGELDGLHAMPPAVIFAPLDIGPEILLSTAHSVIATSHHRNAAAMDRVIAAYLARPDDARAIIMATPASLIVICPRLPEMSVYRQSRPDGLAAVLVADDAPDWLVPVPQPVGSQVRVWRVVR